MGPNSLDASRVPLGNSFVAGLLDDFFSVVIPIPNLLGYDQRTLQDVSHDCMSFSRFDSPGFDLNKPYSGDSAFCSPCNEVVGSGRSSRPDNFKTSFFHSVSNLSLALSSELPAPPPEPRPL